MTIQIIYNEYPLKYDNQIGSFTVGNIIYGGTSGAYATIRRIDRTGATAGILYLEDISGTFQDNEIIYEATYGDELLDEGGFENFTGTEDDGTSDTFTGWTNQNVNDGNGDKVEATATKQAGSYAVKMTKTLASYVGVLSGIGDITVTADNFYIFPFYTRGDGSIAGYYGVYDRTNGAYITDNIVTTGVSGTDYTLVTYVFQAPSGCSAIDVTFRCYNAGTVYFDAASVKNITNAAIADGTVQNPITVNLKIGRKGIRPAFKHERNMDRSYSGKTQFINQYGIQEMQFDAYFSESIYYDLIAWWSWARQGKLWAFTMDSTKTGNTTLDGGAASGQKVIPVAATTDFSVDDICILKREDLDDSYEIITIASISSGVSVTAVSNLKFNYTSGDSLRHLEYWPEVVSLDNVFDPPCEGNDYSWTFKFAEAL